MRVSVTRCLSLGFFAASLCSAAQVPSNPQENSKPSPNGAVQQVPPTPEQVDRMLAGEKEEAKIIAQYKPIIETYIQEMRFDKTLGMVPKTDYYFLGQADSRSRLKVHSLLYSEKKGNWMWTYDPAGFLQMAFPDRAEFDKVHYRFDYIRREFLGDVRCYVFDVWPTSKKRQARFVGRIWVEDQDMTIVRFKGIYEPEVHLSKSLQEEYYLHFDSWRTNVKPGLWLPAYVYIQEMHPPALFGNPSFKAQTYFWGYRSSPISREAELSRVLVESPTKIKEEAPEPDRSPLETQREWRHEAENNILELLERIVILAPPGEVEIPLNRIVKNIEISNNLDQQIDLHCRVLLTTNLEIFAVGDTIVLSRGLIDVVPDEAAMAAMLAYGIADAMLAQPYQDQYAFSDIMRLTATEVLKQLDFQNTKDEAAEISRKALELLNKSPYASQLDKAGLFLAQLHSQAKPLRRLISPQLGNKVYFVSELMAKAPSLQPNSTDQIAALPLGSRTEIDPWTGALRLKKSRPTPLLSPRDKMPLQVTPMFPYLTRYVETSSSESQGGVGRFAGPH